MIEDTRIPYLLFFISFFLCLWSFASIPLFDAAHSTMTTITNT